MPRPPSIQWYYKQWLGDNKVLAMDWDAQGMHFHLLMMSIQETPSGSIPNDVALIRRWLRLPNGQSDSDRVWARVQPQIFAAWVLENDRWFNSGMVQTAERQEKYRRRYEVSTKSVRKINEKSGNLNADEVVVSNLPDFVFEVLKNYPNTKHRTKTTHIEEYAIVEAVARDGEELVMAGVKNYAAAVSSWPKAESKFALGLVKFMQTQEYLADPHKWDRRSKSQIAVDEFLKGEPNDSGKALEDFVRRGDPVVSANAKRSGV